VVLGEELVFATVRNPYDWIISCWLRTGADQTLFEFIRDLSDTSRGGYMREGGIFWHRPDRLLRWERLQEDLNGLLSGLGLPPVSLPRVNATAGKRPWREYYDAETAKLAEERFAGMASELDYEPSPW